MLDYTLDTASSILYLRPSAALAKEDFAQLAKTVDPHIEKTGELAGIILEAAKFPGWESVGAMAAHLRFVREHHKRVKKIAIVTDSAIGSVGERLGSHFVAAEIKHFPAGRLEAAKQWITKR
jgi:stage II sporulation SpoAA-like protein